MELVGRTVLKLKIRALRQASFASLLKWRRCLFPQHSRCCSQESPLSLLSPGVDVSLPMVKCECRLRTLDWPLCVWQ